MPCTQCGRKGHNARTCFGQTFDERDDLDLADDWYRNPPVNETFARMSKYDPQTKKNEAYAKQRKNKRRREKKRKEKKKESGCNIL